MTIPEKNACELLDADHIAVKHLFVTYAQLAVAPASPAAQDRVALARKICGELKVHTQIEEEIFYPALREAAPEAMAQLDEAVREHQEAKDLISQIEGQDETGQVLDQLVSDLNRAIEHHVKEERDELFPKARSCQGIDLMSLGQQLHARQQELQASSPA